MMALLKSKLKSAVKSGKINVFLLFLAVSFIILLLSKLSKDYTKTVSFDIVPLNLPEEQLIIKDSTQKLDVTLKTYGFKLLRYYLSQPKLGIDINETENANNRYTWVAANNIGHIKSQFSDNVEVQSIEQDTLFLDYDVHFVKKVPIVLADEVSFAMGYNLKEDYKLEPDSVRLIGPKILVSEIDSIFTTTLILENVKTNIKETIDLILPNQIAAMTISTKKVTIFGEVDKFTEGKLQIPVSIINVPNNVNITYFPKKVSVVYNVALSNYSSVQIGDFVVQCDFNELSTQQSTFLTPKITMKPETVKSAKINQNKIEFILSK